METWRKKSRKRGAERVQNPGAVTSHASKELAASKIVWQIGCCKNVGSERQETNERFVKRRLMARQVRNSFGKWCDKPVHWFEQARQKGPPHKHEGTKARDGGDKQSGSMN